MRKEIMGYVIVGGVVTTPSGKSQKVSYYDKAVGKALQMANKAGIVNPVVCGKMILPQAVADEAIAQQKVVIPGLDELRAAIAHNQDASYRFDQALERGDGILPATDYIDTDTLKSDYPVAAAYLLAESYYNAAHYAQSTAGKRAMQRIADGEDHEAVIAEMKDEWDKHCEAHIWD